MQRQIEQFKPEEIAAMRAVFPVIRPLAGPAAAPIIDAINAAGYHVINPRADSPLIGLALHVVQFIPGQIAADYDVGAIMARFAANYRPRALIFADSMRYLGVFIDSGRAAGLDVTALENYQRLISIALDAQFAETGTVRCITWLDRAGGAVVAPFMTCIPAADFHVMYYTILESGTGTIKFVVQNYLVEIPFNMTIPPGMTSATIVMIAQPCLDTNGTVLGARLVICADRLLDQHASAPDQMDVAQ